MTDQHPITPPPELVRQWHQSAAGIHFHPYGYSEYIAAKAAQWGADRELEACVNYVDNTISGNKARALRAIRRPKPPSLKEQALAAQQRMWDGTSNHDDWNLIRRALEALDD